MRIIFSNIVILLLVQQSFGQLVSNHTLIAIPDGVDFYAKGGIDNSGIINNNGTLWVAGDWTNTGNFNAGIGTVLFFGNSAQAIDHRQEFNQVMFTGGGRKSIISPATVSALASFERGIVKIKEDAHLYVRKGARIYGGSEESYVIGTLYHEGTGYKLFPIGNESGYFPIEFLQAEGYQPEFTVKLEEGSFGTPDADILSGVSWVKEMRSGTLNQSPIRVAFPSQNQEIPMAMAVGESKNGEVNIVSDVITHSVPFGYSIETVEPVSGNYYAVVSSEENTDYLKKAFYCSNTLSPGAIAEEDRTVRIFGDGLSLENFHFVVYNRWGLVVYETTSLEEMKNEGWDGSHAESRQLLPQGGYPYALSVQRVDGSVIQEKGIITIIR